MSTQSWTALLSRVLTRRRFLAGACALFVAVAASPLRSAPQIDDGQPKPQVATAESRPTDELSLANVESLLKQVQSAQSLDDETRKSLASQYEQAIQYLKHAQDELARDQRYQRDVERAPVMLKELRLELEKPSPVHAVPVLPDDATLAALEKLLFAAKIQATQAQDKANRLKNEPNRRQARKLEIVKLLTKNQERLDQVRRDLANKVANESKDQAKARHILLRAEQLSLERRIAALTAENQFFEHTGELLTTEQLLALRELEQHKRTVERLQQATEQSRRQEAERQRANARRDSLRAHPLLRPIAVQTEVFAQQRTDLARTISVAVTKEKELIALRDKFKEEFAAVTERVRRAGLTYSTGQYLLKQKERLPDPRIHWRNIRNRRTEIDRINLQTYEHDQQRLALANLDAVVEKRMAEFPDSFVPEERLEVETELRRLLDSQLESLTDLVREGNRCFDLLISLEAIELELVAITERYDDFIAENILWIRSSDPLNVRHAGWAWEAACWMSQPSGWLELAKQLWLDMQRPPFLAAIGLLIVLSLWVVERRAKHELVAVGQRSAKANVADFVPTVRALFLTVIISVFGPALLALVAWRSESVWPRDNFLSAVTNGMETTALAYLVVELFRQTCRKDGLGECHFGWRPQGLDYLRRRLRTLMVLGLPVVFIVATTEAQSNELYRDSLGRGAFIVGMLLLAAFARRVLRPTGPVLAEFLLRHEGGWIDRLRFCWYPLGVAVPLLLALIAVLGYTYTALRLAWRLQTTFCFVLGLVFANALVLRWLLLAKRRLAMRRARERREMAQHESSKAPEGVADTAAIAAEMQVVTLAGIDAQTRQFLRSAVVVTLAVGCWLIWVDVLPALSRIGAIELWSTTIKAAQTVTGSESAAALVETVKPITLAQVALAVAIGVLTIVAGRNLPGLLEITILQRLPVDPAGRYAITTVCRYVIGLVGLVVAFGAIGIGWSRVQWLAAAVTVGLGFGLQEIFANFVSGLILLFERPIRVGDIVTVGEISGVVSRIRIRATTVTAWDRKELIIPNKEFITGRVLNWTLSDQVNRVVISVGVAYGSDTNRVREILLQTAREHPLVLRDPPPHALFDSFGESSLNFVLRCYLPNLECRLDVTHELNTAVEKALRDAGVEIPFPQRDLHVRSAPTGLSLAHT
jgi:potassium efflux system protein